MCSGMGREIGPPAARASSADQTAQHREPKEREEAHRVGYHGDEHAARDSWVLVHPKAKRAHQGWRYMTDRQAPPDLAEGELQSDAMPGKLIRELSKLGLA